MAVHEVAELAVGIRADQTELIKGLEDAQRRIGRFGSDLGAKMQSVGRKMTLGITTPLVGLAGVALHTQADFEKTMNILAAATGAPADQMASLQDLAMQMGADTVFSAGEAAGAMLELAKAGVDTTQIMGGGLQGTMALAAAGSVDLATASTVAANAMNAFGLQGDDMTSIADALAGAANASTAEIGSLAEALQQGSNMAVNAGMSLQETVGTLAAFDQMGIKGSDAGTSLKTMLMRLVPSTDAAAKQMDALGLKFTDAEGNFLSIAQIAEQLQNSLGGLSEEQRTAALNTMFGADAARAASVLMRQGAEGINKYTQAAMEQGAAQEMADAAMSGTAGTMEQLKGSLETAALSLGTVLAPAFKVAADALKGMADWFTGLSEPAKTFVAILGGLAAAAGPILVVSGTLIKNGKLIKGAFDAMSAGIKGAGGALKLLQANPALLWLTAIAVIAFLIIDNWDTLKKWFGQFGEWLGDLFAGVGEWIGRTMEGVSRWFRNTWEGVVGWFSALPERIAGFFSAMGQRIMEVGGAVVGWLIDKWMAYLNFWIGLPAQVLGIFKQMINGLISLWNGLDFGIHVELPDWLGGWSLDIADIVPDIPMLAKGGIVRRPTLAVIGEAGPEAVVPLSSSRGMAAFGGGGDQSLAVTVRLDRKRFARDADWASAVRGR